MKISTRFLCLFLLVLSVPLGLVYAQQPELEIYQGIIPTASGPGMEVVLYLYGDGESYVRYQYLKVPGEWYHEFGSWTLKGALLNVRPLMPEGISFTFIKRNAVLYLSSPQGTELYKGIPRSVLVRISQ